MFIRFTALDSQGHVRECSWYIGNLEFGLDALSTLVAKGNILIEAELIDSEQQRTLLPIDAFDGTILSPFIQALEEEVQLILNLSISLK
jgi:hypothetical protein